MKIEQLDEDVQHIKDDLNKLMNSVSSQEEKQEKIIEIRNKANETKNQLEKEILTLNDEEKEKAQVLLDYLNEIINFELSLTVTQQSNNESWNKNWWSWEKQESWETENKEEKWLRKWRNWLSDWQKKWIRIWWWVISWLWIWKLGKRIFGWKKEKNEKKEKKSFWERPIGKFLKWTWVWTAVYYVSHGITTWKWNIKEAFNRKKDTDNNPSEGEQNHNNENKNSTETETPTENMEWNSNWNENQNNSWNDNQKNSWDESQNNSENENIETFDAINADSFSNAAIATLNNAKSFNAATTNKIKTTLNNYLQTNPLLKKSANGHMVFEISDKTKFSNTIKQVWADALSWLNMIERWLAKAIFWWKLDDINKTMRELSPKEYKNVVFKYLWWIVKDMVKAENWTMTVKEFYDSVKKCYPNKNANAIESALINSGQANIDIKNMDIEKIKNA